LVCEPNTDTKKVQKPISDICTYDKQIQGIFRKIEQDLPKKTVELIYNAKGAEAIGENVLSENETPLTILLRCFSI